MSVHSKPLQSTHVKSSKGDRVFYAINCIFLGLLALIILYPLYFIIIAAISDPDAVLAGEVVLYPVKVTLSGFAKILERTDAARICHRDPVPAREHLDQLCLHAC